METVKVTIQVKKEVTTTIELELPFFGRMQQTERFIRISRERDIHTITHWKHFGNCWEYMRWNYLDSVNIGEYVPCTSEEWDQAVMNTVGYLATLIINHKNQ